MRQSFRILKLIIFAISPFPLPSTPTVLLSLLDTPKELIRYYFTSRIILFWDVCINSSQSLYTVCPKTVGITKGFLLFVKMIRGSMTLLDVFKQKKGCSPILLILA